jgi:hypothetical protein
MTWLQPWSAWFLAGVPVIVLLYFLRLKRRPLTVSTLIFWQRVMQESGRRTFFQKFRHLFSLLLHLLIFLLLLGAHARPVFDRGILEGSATVLILDTRARMRAVEPGGHTRFETARQLAQDYVRQAGGAREFALLTLGAAPTVAVPFTGDEKLLRSALAQVLPTDATGDISSAITLADALLAARKGSHLIVLITANAPDTPPQTASKLITHAIGTSLDNVAITRFATRPLPSNPETSEVLLETQNFGRSSVHTDVELAFDGRPLEVKPLTLAPGERRLDVFTSVPRPALSARGWLMAKLSTNDALPFDNIAYATLPSSRLNRVLLVSKGNTFLEKLLGVDPSVKFQFVAPEAYQPAMSGKFGAVIFDGFVPVGFDLEKSAGNILFLNATPFTGKGAPLDQPIVTDVDAAHPTTRLVSLQNVTILHAQPLELPAVHDGWTFTAPLRSAEHPLLITGERGHLRVAALAFDVLESDLPLRVAFPLLIHSTIQWLAGERAESAPVVSAGEVFQIPSGMSVVPKPLTAPLTGRIAGQQPALTGFFQPLHNGFYQVTGDGPAHWIAVNTFSAAESDLRVSGGSNAVTATPSISAEVFHGWPPWQWLALVAFIFIIAEWWLFHQRKTE